ncbi:MAG: hypothetical protein BWY61_01400 [Firmicutes bacterium ADurb.Bin354]|nr:MAG: hypothetical protein BWY61_01400 [Firmicutes bacterium ADurb.Bin354]
MVSYAEAMERKGIEKERENGLEAIVRSLKKYISDFDTLYNAVIKYKSYSKVTKDQVMKYFED